MKIVLIVFMGRNMTMTQGADHAESLLKKELELDSKSIYLLQSERDISAQKIKK